ncbi:MAG: tetratricopeptide repeat protein [Gammaproteobacteria bacterium]
MTSKFGSMRNLLIVNCALALLAGCGTAATTKVVPESPPEGFETLAGAASYHVLLAEMALQKDLYDVAVDEYLNAARYSDDPDVAEKATELAFDLGRDEAALTAATRWRALAPDDVAAHRYLLRLFVRDGNVDEAADTLATLLEQSDQNEDDSFLALSSLLLQEADTQTALDAMSRLVARNKKVPRAQYSLGVMALRAGELELAKKAARRAAELSPDWAHANLLYARALIADGKVEEGINYASERVGGQNSTSERLEYGILLAAVDRDDEARVVLSQVLSDDRANPGALRAIGLLYLKEGDLESARASFTQLLATGRSTYDALFYLASIAESENQLRRAIRLYGQVIEGPNAVASQLRVAGLLANGGEPEEALQHLERFAAAQPRYTVDMALGQGEILMDDGQLDRALTLYDDVLAAYPEETRVQYARAFLLEDLDRVDDALHQLRLVLAKNPSDPNALNALGYTLADRTDQVDEAFELIAKAYELESNSPAIIDSLGWVQFKRGNLNEAQSLLERAYQMFPDGEIAAHLVEVLWNNGAPDDARTLLEQSLGRAPQSPQLLDVKARLGL